MPRLHDVIARRSLKLGRRQWKRYLASIWTSSVRLMGKYWSDHALRCDRFLRSLGFGSSGDTKQTAWTGLCVEESNRMTEDKDKWRKYVHHHGAFNPRIEDG